MHIFEIDWHVEQLLLQDLIDIIRELRVQTRIVYPISHFLF